MAFHFPQLYHFRGKRAANPWIQGTINVSERSEAGMLERTSMLGPISLGLFVSRQTEPVSGDALSVTSWEGSCRLTWSQPAKTHVAVDISLREVSIMLDILSETGEDLSISQSFQSYLKTGGNMFKNSSSPWKEEGARWNEWKEQTPWQYSKVVFSKTDCSGCFSWLKKTTSFSFPRWAKSFLFHLKFY